MLRKCFFFNENVGLIKTKAEVFDTYNKVFHKEDQKGEKKIVVLYNLYLQKCFMGLISA